jgi:O-antigen biosynthesis protein WbqV
MIRLPRLTSRQILIVLHDLVATAAAIGLTFVMRFEDQRLFDKLPGLELFVPVFLIYAAVVYFIFGLHRNKWRFTSVPDLYNIFRAATILAVSLLALDYVLLAPNVYGQFFFGKITILLYWFLQMFLLGGSRIAYRYFHYSQTLQRAKIADATPTLVLGRAADAEVLLRSIESGAVKKIWPVGILSPSQNDRGQAIRGIPVLGDISDLERVVADLGNRGTRVTRAVLAPSALSPEARPESILIRAHRLGLNLSQLPSLDSGGPAVQLAPVSVEDLLLRPSVSIDYRRLEQFVSGKSVVVTGGGAKSATWRQVVADICAAPVVVLEQDEGAAFGAALQALQLVESASGIADIGALVDAHTSRDESRCCEPDATAVRFYNDAYRDYQRAVDAAAGLYA